jgi:signal transduction histidine kinase
MRFTVRSLGGKLVMSAAVMLLLCILLFSVSSWYFLKSFYEHEATIDAGIHLAAIDKAYQAKIAALIEDITAESKHHDLIAVLANPHKALTPASRGKLDKMLAALVSHDQLSSSAIISMKGSVIGGDQVSPNTKSIIHKALSDNLFSELYMADIYVAVPINKKDAGEQIGVLFASQHIDGAFAAELVKATNTSLNFLLCEPKSHNILATPMSDTDSVIHNLSYNALCASETLSQINGTEHYLVESALVQGQNQLAKPLSLEVVDIEPLYNIAAHTERAVLILVGLAVFIMALGVTGYALVVRIFFVRPVRQIQSRVATLVADNAETEFTTSSIDELSMLSRSFMLLSESLTMRENESNVITRQMSDLLTMSDVLISTLNLEDLLGEIVSRLGYIMQAKGAALLLYGREMQSPWAVAQWTNQQISNGSLAAISASQQYGAVTVHTDPAGDITMTATTKMAAVAVPAKRPVPTSSGMRSAIRVPKLTSQAQQISVRIPRIPRPALRDLDMILARMAMQKQKIAYGEDVRMIYQESGEAWARMALEAGYCSVIAVPLLLQDQVIGAFVLYGDRPYKVSRRDTFLLSTAAIQAAMAIQNALLFAEVKDKNAALERVNHLKSQFLATVTHELRTPLHSIISYGALILEGFVEGELTTEQEEHIQFIVRRAEDLSRLVDEMLDLSKIEADRLEVKVEPLTLEPSLLEAVNQLKPMASNKGLQLTIEMEESLPMVLADSQRIRQVVINMVSNALKFTEKGGVTIRCALLDRYDMLRISVSDTGIGISPAALEYIFEAFRQADGSTTRRFGGTGLGLTIARKLIELQGGEVSVESVIGKGSTFSFTLPVASTSRVRVS